MRGYAIDPNTGEHGTYEEIPVGHIHCAEPPTDEHVMADIWQTDPTAQTFDPMDPVQCWRTKTTQEQDQEADDKAAAIVQDFQKSPALKVLINALMSGDFEPGMQYTPAQLKQIAKANM